MKKEEQAKKISKKNKSADYYSKDVYNYGSVYGISEDHSTHNTSKSEEIPVESWGWSNNTD